MTENSTISSKFLVHKIKKLIFLQILNFKYGIFLFYHNLNPLGIPIPKIYAPNPDNYFPFLSPFETPCHDIPHDGINSYKSSLNKIDS